MKQGWITKTLGDACEIYQPKTITGKDMVENGQYPVFGANGIIGRYNKYNHEEPQVLITCRGATCGTVNISEPFSWVTGNAMVVRPKDTSIDLKFLEYAFQGGVEIHKAITGAAQPQITRANLSPLTITYPISLEEQRRIVDILSRAEGIVHLRREAEQKAAELIPALFIDMFGDPATNPKGWPISKFGDVGVLDRGKSRHRPRDAAELYGDSYPFIQTGDVANSGGRITKHSVYYSEKGLAQSKLWNAGTLCITIAANIAKTGVLTFDACFPDSVVGFLPGNNVRTNYVQAWLAFLQPTLEANAPQAAQKNINLEILRNLPIILPPLKLQTEFEKQCESVFSIQSQQATATEKAQAAFNALLDQAFS